jgi:hypothetical protein
MLYDNVDEDIPFVGAEPDNRHSDIDLHRDKRGIGTDDAIESDLEEEDSDEGEDSSESSNKLMIE